MRRRALQALAAAALLAGCRNEMQDQPRHEALETTGFFADGRADRLPPPGTVARDAPAPDPHLHLGMDRGRPAASFPFRIDRTALLRGRQRYDVFCAPCHGVTGDGDGVVVRYGFPRPSSFHEARLREAPPGYLFDVISRGFGRMYSFAGRLDPADRWRVVAHLRVLQKSRRVQVGELTDDERRQLADAPP